jgi:hypothetical protein
VADVAISGIVGAVTGGTAGPALARLAPRAGSMAWNNVRGRVRTALKNAGASLRNIQIHHWLIKNNGRLVRLLTRLGVPRRSIDWFIQRSWNYKPLRNMIHKRIHGRDLVSELPRFNIFQRWWYGTPGWAKAMQGSIVGGATGKVTARIFGSECQCAN